MRIFALVITYNRKDSLKLCLKRLLRQKRKVDHILVINNNSSDGTRELLDEYIGQCTVINMETNIGGAGAYHYGFRWCVENGADWIWGVEDDILAPRDFTQKAEEWISSAKTQQVGYIYPSVLSVYNRQENDVVMYLSKSGSNLNGAPEIDRALFSGILVNAKAIKEVGLPIKEFFIYYDDWEFTTRMSKAGWKGYWLKEAFVWHNDKPRPKITSYIHGRKEEMWKFYYGIRNELSVLKKEAPEQYYRQLLRHMAIIPLKILLNRPQNKLTVAISWAQWAFKSLSFKFKIDKVG